MDIKKGISTGAFSKNVYLHSRFPKKKKKDSEFTIENNSRLLVLKWHLKLNGKSTINDKQIGVFKYNLNWSAYQRRKNNDKK